MTMDASTVRARAAERLADLAEAIRRTSAECGEAIALAATMVRDTLAAGGTLYLCGNGGSAADAQHIATEYVVRYRKQRRALAAVALTTDTSVLTAAGNDLGFAEVFARQVEALLTPQDLLVIHSTSGNSPNVVRAAHAARTVGARVLALTAGDGGALRELATHVIVVPVDRTDRAQELHLCIQHIICELVEDDV